MIGKVVDVLLGSNKILIGWEFWLKCKIDFLIIVLEVIIVGFWLLKVIFWINLFVLLIFNFIWVV